MKTLFPTDNQFLYDTAYTHRNDTMHAWLKKRNNKILNIVRLV